MNYEDAVFNYTSLVDRKKTKEAKPGTHIN